MTVHRKLTALEISNPVVFPSQLSELAAVTIASPPFIEACDTLDIC